MRRPLARVLRIAAAPVLLVGAAAAAWLPTPPTVIDRWYAAGVYPIFQRALTSFSNRVPFALFDLLIVVGLIAWIGLAARDIAARRRRGVWRAAWRIALRTAVGSAVLYLAFLATWGFNYRRTPLVDRLPFDRSAATPAAARALALETAARLNALYASAHATGFPDRDAIDPALADALSFADSQIGGSGRVVAARPKRTLFDPYFRRTAVDGMTDPFFLETLVSTDLLPFERPFVVAHEWSHLAGLADEGDANFLGWLACVRGPVPAQYSGWLFLYAELAANLRGPARADLASHLEAGPRNDLAQIRARLLQHVNPKLSAAGWRVYDSYLKANRIEAGAQSYGHVVDLVLGVRFGPGWSVQR